MNKLKFLFASLFVMFAFAAQAQQVVINKTDGTSEVFQPNEVDSVVYKPAPKYYYYAGWECPKNEAELANLAVEPNGGLVDMTKTYTKSNPIRDLSTEDLAISSDVRSQYYIVIPKGHSIYDDDGDVTSMQYDEVTTITISNHTVWKSAGNTKKIYGIFLY